MTRAAPFDPRMRGYAVFYRPGGSNICPGCGRSHWYVGRISAECAFCTVALPLCEPGGGRFDPDGIYVA
ncbi:hypothetical protein CLG96_02950 [Sphingomonas oleivorans]|uniref:Uncharacterized protein n=2 Tax=Sphingomonas oleivorans TaxID=1735121 RepID=A0A2T5G339_9SPHN|nr:hypothetical protein CLG96_02950 [Sphingomonas oleivorans]